MYKVTSKLSGKAVTYPTFEAACAIAKRFPSGKAIITRVAR